MTEAQSGCRVLNKAAPDQNAPVTNDHDLRQPTSAPSARAAAGEMGRLVTTLLKVPADELKLPPRLMKLYLQSRWASRRKLIVLWLLGFSAINALVAMFDPLTSNEPGVWIVLFGRLGASAFMAAAALALARMETCGREGFLTISSCLSVALVAAFGGLLVEPHLMKHAFDQAMLGGVVAILVARISWDDTIRLCGVMLVILAAVMAFAPGIALADRLQTIALWGASLVTLTFMRGVQNRFLYRVFLEGLDERLRREAMKGANGRLAAMARTDPLTLLPNRRHFDETVAELQSAGPPDGATALFMIDIDYFKRINDDLGHAAGDDCLRAVAAAIRGELRDGRDFLARFGGEEFVAILRDVEQPAALAVAERLRAAVADLGIVNRASPFGVVTVSVGVAASPPASVAEMLSRADRALYEAKSLGRNRVRAADPARVARVA